MIVASICCCKKTAEGVKKNVTEKIEKQKSDAKAAAHTKQMNADAEKNQMV